MKTDEHGKPIRCLIQKSKECSVTSLAMLIYGDEATPEHVDKLYEEIGHRSPDVHIQELIDVARAHDLWLVGIDSLPAIKRLNEETGKWESQDIYDGRVAQVRMVMYMRKHRGLCYCQLPTMQSHMHYWDKECYHDPSSGLINESFPPFLATFYAAIPIIS